MQLFMFVVISVNMLSYEFPIYNLYIQLWYIVTQYIHSVLASYIIVVHVVCMCKQEGWGIIVQSFDKSRDNAPLHL